MLKYQIKLLCSFALLAFMCFPLSCRDILVEFRTAYFLPTDSCLKNIYGKGGALYGPEITFQLFENNCWYGFASINFLSKKGHSIGLCDPTDMKIIPLALGIKYLVPFCDGSFYVGLGFQPTRLKTVNCSLFAIQNTSKWGLGGIAKVGLYYNLTSHSVIDFFVDYSFVSVKSNNCSKCIVPLKANLNAVLFGAGLGYTF